MKETGSAKKIRLFYLTKIIVKEQLLGIATLEKTIMHKKRLCITLTHELLFLISITPKFRNRSTRMGN
jgi:hypothetical protein